MSTPERAPRGLGESSVDIPAESWEGVSAAQLEADWRLPVVRLFRRISSTNDVARVLAQDGFPAGTLVLAEEQIGGRGRGARTWSSPPGLGLWSSLVVRETPAPVGMLPIRVALAVAQALDPWTEGAVQVKWPNDLMVGGRKLGGILCEASWEGHRLDHVIVGVGINLLQDHRDFPVEIREVATSVREIPGAEPIHRLEIATSVFSRLGDLLRGRHTSSAEETVETFRARDALRGQAVVVYEPQSEREIVKGVATGIDLAGGLLVDAGTRTIKVSSGTVRTL